MKELKLVECLMSDCEFIYRLANDKECRKNSFNSEFIDYETHQKWFESSMKNKNRKIYIVQYNQVKIGQIRIDIINNEYGEISYSLEEQYRGKGIGSRVLGVIKETAIREIGTIRMLKGKVRTENISSRKAFLKNGYLESRLNDICEYTLELKK